MLWREWARAPSAAADPMHRDPDRYWTTELRRWTTGPKKDWTALQSACLRSTVAGGQWSQERLFRAGFVDDPMCTACGRALGTLDHRNWTCKCLQPEREQCIPPELLAEARAALTEEPDHAFWSRGLMPIKWLPQIPAVEAEKQCWIRDVSEGCFTGEAFTDGSLRQRPWWVESERAGWGIASVERIANSQDEPLPPAPTQQQPQQSSTSGTVAVAEVLREPQPLQPPRRRCVASARFGRHGGRPMLYARPLESQKLAPSGYK